MFHKIEINPSSPPSFQLPAECLMAKIAAVFYDKDQQLSISWIKICPLFYIKQYVAVRLSSEKLKTFEDRNCLKKKLKASFGKTKKL